MNKKQQLKAEKAVDKMLGVNKLYITLSSPMVLSKGDRINVSGEVGENGEIVAGRIDITRNFFPPCPPPSIGVPTGIGMPNMGGIMKRG
jgi:hypothetical protein